MSMNISSVNNIMSFVSFDPEHQRIIRELRALGLEPTGDKSADKAKLEAAKSAQKAENNQAIIFQPVDASNETEKNQAYSAKDEIKNSISASTQNMTGAEQLSRLNKFKLLGLY